MTRKIKKINNYNYSKERTRGTVQAILTELQGITEEEILSALFVPTESEFMKQLLKDFEWMLLDAVVNPKRFAQNLHQFYKDKSKQILNVRKLKEFFIFTQAIYEIVATKEVDTKIETAYYDLVIQIIDYLSETGKHIIGISHGVTPILVDELYPNIDKLIAEIINYQQNNRDSNENFNETTYRHFQNNGYFVRTEKDLDYLFHSDRVYTNMEYSMIPFINEKNAHILIRPYLSIHVNTIDFGLQNLETVEIKEWLKSRKRLLPAKGIYLDKIRETNVQELYLAEVVVDEKLFMIYRIKVNDTYAYGYFNTKTLFFHSLYNNSTTKESIIKNLEIENYVLENYALLTTNMPSNEVVSVIETENKVKRKHVLDRSKLHDSEAYVSAYVRKLPIGASASDDAVSFASKYGITLESDETFVRPFVKAVHIKKN